MAGVILFTGNIDIGMLRKLSSGATQPTQKLAARADNEKLEKEAAEARFKFRHANNLKRLLDCGALLQASMSAQDVELLAALRDGSLREAANRAVVAFGHGMLRK